MAPHARCLLPGQRLAVLAQAGQRLFGPPAEDLTLHSTLAARCLASSLALQLSALLWEECRTYCPVHAGSGCAPEAGLMLINAERLELH